MEEESTMMVTDRVGSASPSDALVLLKRKMLRTRGGGSGSGGRSLIGSVEAGGAIDDASPANRKKDAALRLKEEMQEMMPPSSAGSLLHVPRRSTPSVENASVFSRDPFLPPPSSGRRVVWECNKCAKPCIPVRSESRCLCGHRYREHKDGVKQDGRFKCMSPRCLCSHFFFVVAEGAWILRCRCKHKHTDHDSSTAPFHCNARSCKCQAFDSPWVCNCSHPWAEHKQRVTAPGERPSGRAEDDPFSLHDLTDVQRTNISVPLPAYGTPFPVTHNETERGQVLAKKTVL